MSNLKKSKIFCLLLRIAIDFLENKNNITLINLKYY